MKGFTQYVVGFAFCGREVVLIRKTKPEWQLGKLNGVGGHVEDETPREAMSREFSEETGLLVPVERWKSTVCIQGIDWHMCIFTAIISVEELNQCHTTTEEEVLIENIDHSLYRGSWLSNLCWLIPLSRYFLDTPEENLLVDISHKRVINLTNKVVG